MSGTVNIQSGSETYLQVAVANVGPVSAAVDASNNAFRVSMQHCVNCVLWDSYHVSVFSYCRVILYM